MLLAIIGLLSVNAQQIICPAPNGRFPVDIECRSYAICEGGSQTRVVNCRRNQRFDVTTGTCRRQRDRQVRCDVNENRNNFIDPRQQPAFGNNQFNGLNGAGFPGNDEFGRQGFGGNGFIGPNGVLGTTGFGEQGVGRNNFGIDEFGRNGQPGFGLNGFGGQPLPGPL